MQKRPRINNEINGLELRLLDEEGKNLGVVKTGQAIEMARDRGLDLIEISPNAAPPVARIMDLGKFLYNEKRKEKESAKSGQDFSEMKNVRIHLGTSEHDLEMKAGQASEFLKKGNRVRVELFLKGREKYLEKNFLRGRFDRILNLIAENYKILQDVKTGPRGINIVIEKIK
ncbi:MAG: translation initiation factor IF-3 [Candidatus Pacebacteria bacterium]|nr:translation initiation factor IF-3 [Candidatus Paceibacterota bacterium]